MSEIKIEIKDGYIIDMSETPMLKRVAAGIYAADRTSVDWPYKMARAAIAAMREPTEAMVIAGEDVIFDEDREYEGSELSKLPTAFRAMIDEALK